MAAVAYGVTWPEGDTGTITRLPTVVPAVKHSRPYHPQTCGKIERWHQTLKRFLAKQTPARTVAELQAQLDRFVDAYNQDGPTGPGGQSPLALPSTPWPRPIPDHLWPKHTSESESTRSIPAAR